MDTESALFNIAYKRSCQLFFLTNGKSDRRREISRAGKLKSRFNRLKIMFQELNGEMSAHKPGC
jgi:hypothetical protein